MWRFINSIPRAFRLQQCHGPRASVGVHVDEGEQESCQVQESLAVERLDLNEHHEGFNDCKEDVSGEAEEDFAHEFKRKTSVIRSIILGWNPRHEGYFSRYTHQGERTKEDKEEQWWKACRHDLCNFLSGNHLLEILTLGLFHGQSADGNKKSETKKKLLYRVLFSISNGDNALYVSGNKSSQQLRLPSLDASLDDKAQHKADDSTDKVPDSVPTQIQADNPPPESIESAIIEFQEICQEYSSKNESLLGLAKAEEGNMVEAFRHFKRACSMGNITGCFNVGLCYETGSGVLKDIDKAVNFYEKAAEQGHRLALYNLGLLYLNKTNSTLNSDLYDMESLQGKGKMYIKEAAELGLAEALTQMGIYCMEQENAEEAADYFRAAASQNDCEAQYFLAMCYEEGLGVKVNLEKAALLYSQAASAGHEGAAYNLAVFTELGLGGITGDTSAAIELYRKASEAGHTLATSRLEELVAERARKSCQEEEARQRREDVHTPSLSLRVSTSGFSTLSPSASSPDLLKSSYSDITSFFFPESASDSSHQVSFATASSKLAQGRKNGGFYIGDEGGDSFSLRNLDPDMFTRKSREQSLNFHKSHTSPNLRQMVACQI